MPLAGDNRCPSILPTPAKLSKFGDRVRFAGARREFEVNTSMPGPSGWIPPGIGRGTPAARAPSSGAARCPAHRVPGGAWPCRRPPSVR